MSERDFKSFNIADIRNIKRTDLTLKAYNSTIIIPLGYFMFNIKFKDSCKMLKLYIIKEEGPPIIGRDWLEEFNIFSSQLNINSITCDMVMDKFPNVFKRELECYKHKYFELYLKEDAIPTCCKPWVIPFASKKRVSNEIERLIKEDILVPVETSDWATPVVPVVKSDGGIRLCGDYTIL